MSTQDRFWRGMQRGGQPEEIADAILYLLGPGATYVTGSILDVAGGR